MSEARSDSRYEPFSYDMSEVADKLQSLHLQDHGRISRSRRSRIGIRVRRRRVRLRVSPLLGYLRGLLQLVARSASIAAGRSRLGLRRLSSKRARRIHSVQAATYDSDEQAQPLLDCIHIDS